jgi:hypothetical protein
MIYFGYSLLVLAYDKAPGSEVFCKPRSAHAGEALSWLCWPHSCIWGRQFWSPEHICPWFPFQELQSLVTHKFLSPTLLCLAFKTLYNISLFCLECPVPLLPVLGTAPGPTSLVLLVPLSHTLLTLIQIPHGWPSSSSVNNVHHPLIFNSVNFAGFPGGRMDF